MTRRIDGPLVGTRYWLATANTGALRSASWHVAWPITTEWQTARCLSGRHPAPAHDCRCGFHVMSPHYTELSPQARHPYVFGAVQVTGRCELHDTGVVRTTGVRAERARIVALAFVLPADHPYYTRVYGHQRLLRWRRAIEEHIAAVGIPLMRPRALTALAMAGELGRPLRPGSGGATRPAEDDRQTA